MFGKRKRNNLYLYCIEMSHSEEWLIFSQSKQETKEVFSLVSCFIYLIFYRELSLPFFFRSRLYTKFATSQNPF